ncbi:von Willebrand factor type A domain-containing protein [Phycisphaeraceae bacterium D3-23]
MNREQAETLLAALVADELDEPVRGELIAYLATDASLSERLGDMRAAAGLVRAGLEAESAQLAPAGLTDAQRAELLARVEREPIAAGPVDAPPQLASADAGTENTGDTEQDTGTLPGVSVLYSFRVAGAAAACVALGVGLVGLSLPEGASMPFVSMESRNATDAPANKVFGYGYDAADDAVDAVEDAIDDVLDDASRYLHEDLAESTSDFFGDSPSRNRQPSAPPRITAMEPGLIGPLGDFDGDTSLMSGRGGLEAHGYNGGVQGGITLQGQASPFMGGGQSFDLEGLSTGAVDGWATDNGVSIDPMLADASRETVNAFEQRRGAVRFADGGTAPPDDFRSAIPDATDGLPDNGSNWAPAVVSGVAADNPFGAAPSFDLNEALSNSNPGGSNAGAGGGRGGRGGGEGFGYGVFPDEADEGRRAEGSYDRRLIPPADPAERPASSGDDLLAQARAQSTADKLAEAEEASRSGQDHLARQLYEEAALLNPNDPDIAARLAQAEGQTRPGLRPIDPLTDRAADIAITRQESAARYEQAMERAARARANGEHDAAMDAVIEARTHLNANRSAYSEAERNEMISRAARMQAGINEQRAMEEARIARESEYAQEETESVARALAEQRRAEEVQERLRNARAYQENRDYAAAIDELEAALFIDPHNEAVDTLRDLLQDVMVATEGVQLHRELDLMRSNHQLINDEAIIPYDELLTYPGEWPELTQMRLAGLEGEGGESEANQAATLALQRELTVNFENARLGAVIDYLRDTTGANITVNWPALEIPRITEDTPVTIALARVPAEQLLKLILEQAGANALKDDKLGYTIVEGIVQISTLDELKTFTEVRLYDISPLLEGKAEPQRAAAIAEIYDMIHNAVGDPDDWRDESSTLRELNGNLIIKTTPDAHREMAALLQRLMPEEEIEERVPSAIPPVNPWVLTEHDAQSTFALDTDTASYELARRTIREQAQLPAIASVRMEEFVNRFDYQYPAGRAAHDTFTVHAEAGDAPFAQDGVVLLKIGVRGRVVARDQMKPAHYVFVIDASGSMAREDRLPLVRQSLAMLLGQLGEQDTVSLVSYDTQPFLLLEYAPANQPGRILDAAATIQTGGSTNLTDGLALGYQVAARHFVSGTVNRVVLCSDGVANVGNDDAQQMLDAVDEYRRQGVTLMTVGVGVDGHSVEARVEGSEQFNDGLLEQLANRGDGRYVYLGSVADAQRQLVEDLAATRPTIAYDAKIQVHFDPARVRRYRLIGYENREIADRDFRNDAVDAGEVGSGQSATALYEIELYPDPARVGGGRSNAGAGSGGGLGTVYVRYRDAATNEVRETATALTRDIVQERSVRDDPRFYLAACAAEFAELLRESEHAADGDYYELDQTARRVAEALPLDRDAAELSELIRRSRGLPRAGQ